MSYRKFPPMRRVNVSTPVRLGVAAVAACFISAQVYANPVNPTVVNGAATFNQTGNVLTVTNSNGAIIDWDKFSIKAGETTHFAQTAASSTVLNRVLNDPTAIYGTLSSNGRVWLVNPAGIMVGPGGRVDTAGFVASTLAVRNEDFLAGRNLFVNQGGAGNVINQGEIRTPAGGSVYLIGSNVSNEGIITTPGGETILAAGATVSLIDSATPGVKVDITGVEGNATNLGQITAEAGRIGIAGVIVRNSGTLSASSVVNQGGRIFLKASQDAYVDGNGRIVTTGTKGGSIEVLGERVAVMDSAAIDASGAKGGGRILVGGDYQGKNPEIQNASMSYLGRDASLRADATEVGAGGTVVVWADDTTRAYGSISARGGAGGGDGGLVETSGKRGLDTVGIRVNASAVNGLAGSWLLDPNDVQIVNGAGADANVAYGGGIWDAINDSAIVYGDNIADALNAGTSVIIQTGASGTNSQYGDITMSGVTLAVAPANYTSLSLKAHRSIVIDNSSISSSVNGLDLTLNAHYASDVAPGNVQITNSSINTNGGSVVIGGGLNPNLTAAIGYEAGFKGVLLDNAAISTGAGNILIHGQGFGAGSYNIGVGLINGASLTTTSGAVALTGVGGDDQLGVGSNRGLMVGDSGSAATIVTDSGKVTLTGTGGYDGDGVQIQNGSRVLSTTGDIEIKGVGCNSATGSTYCYGTWITAAGTSAGSRTLVKSGGNISIGGTSLSIDGYSNRGLLVENDAIVQATGAGTIALAGIGGYDGDGLQLKSGAQVLAETGKVTVSGTSGQGTGGNYGVYLTGSNTLVASGGDIDIRGESSTSQGTDNIGLVLIGGANVQANGTGKITLTGTGGAGTDWNGGVWLAGAGTMVSSVDGNIDISGTAAGSGDYNLGIEMSGGARVRSLGLASINLTGIGGAGTDYNDGIYLSGTGSSGTAVQSAFGAIALNGQGAGTGTSNIGIRIRNGATVSATDFGSITLVGSGGGGTDENQGVAIYTNAGEAVSTLQSSAGSISITGYGGGSGTLNHGIHVNGAFINTNDLGSVALQAHGSGMAGDIDIATALLSSSTELTLYADNDIHLGSNAGYGSMVQSSGAMTVSAGHDLNLIGGSGDVSGWQGPGATLQSGGAQTITVGNQILLQAGSANNTTHSGSTMYGASVSIQSDGDQDVSAGAIKVYAGSSGHDNSAEIRATGNQSITIYGGVLDIRGGGDASATVYGGQGSYNNQARIQHGQSSGGDVYSGWGDQTVTIYGGATVNIQAGSGTGALGYYGSDCAMTTGNPDLCRGSSNGAMIENGIGGQTLDFVYGGAISATGGGAGTQNWAGITSHGSATTQDILGNPDITLTGGGGGGSAVSYGGETFQLSNDAGINSQGTGSQTINANSITLNGGNANYGGAGVSNDAGTGSAITTVGNLSMYGGSSSAGDEFAGGVYFGNKNGGAINLNVGGDLYITAGSGSSAPAIIGTMDGAGNVQINVGGNVSIVAAGSHVAIGSQSATYGATVNISAGGNLTIADSATRGVVVGSLYDTDSATAVTLGSGGDLTIGSDTGYGALIGVRNSPAGNSSVDIRAGQDHYGGGNLLLAHSSRIDVGGGSSNVRLGAGQTSATNGNITQNDGSVIYGGSVSLYADGNLTLNGGAFASGPWNSYAVAGLDSGNRFGDTYTRSLYGGDVSIGGRLESIGALKIFALSGGATGTRGNIIQQSSGSISAGNMAMGAWSNVDLAGTLSATIALSATAGVSIDCGDGCYSSGNASPNGGNLFVRGGANLNAPTINIAAADDIHLGSNAGYGSMVQSSGAMTVSAGHDLNLIGGSGGVSGSQGPGATLLSGGAQTVTAGNQILLQAGSADNTVYSGSSMHGGSAVIDAMGDQTITAPTIKLAAGTAGHDNVAAIRGGGAKQDINVTTLLDLKGGEVGEGNYANIHAYGSTTSQNINASGADVILTGGASGGSLNRENSADIGLGNNNASGGLTVHAGSIIINGGGAAFGGAGFGSEMGGSLSFYVTGNLTMNGGSADNADFRATPAYIGSEFGGGTINVKVGGNIVLNGGSGTAGGVMIGALHGDTCADGCDGATSVALAAGGDITATGNTGGVWLGVKDLTDSLGSTVTVKAGWNADAAMPTGYGGDIATSGQVYLQTDGTSGTISLAADESSAGAKGGISLGEGTGVQGNAINVVAAGNNDIAGSLISTGGTHLKSGWTGYGGGSLSLRGGNIELGANSQVSGAHLELVANRGNEDDTTGNISQSADSQIHTAGVTSLYASAAGNVDLQGSVVIDGGAPVSISAGKNIPVGVDQFFDGKRITVKSLDAAGSEVNLYATGAIVANTKNLYSITANINGNDTSASSGGIEINNTGTAQPMSVSLTDNAAANSTVSFAHNGSDLAVGPNYNFSTYGGTGSILVAAPSNTLNYYGGGNLYGGSIMLAGSNLNIEGPLSTSGNLDLGAGNTLNVNSLVDANTIRLVAPTINLLSGAAHAVNDAIVIGSAINVGSGMNRLTGANVLLRGATEGTGTLNLNGGVAATSGSLEFNLGSINAYGGGLFAPVDIVGLVTGDILLGGGAYIHAGNDVWLTHRGTTSLLSMVSGGHVLAGMPTTIHLDFPNRDSSGVVTDGSPGSGLFVVVNGVVTPATPGNGLELTLRPVLPPIDPCVANPDLCKPPAPKQTPIEPALSSPDPKTDPTQPLLDPNKTTGGTEDTFGGESGNTDQQASDSSTDGKKDEKDEKDKKDKKSDEAKDEKKDEKPAQKKVAQCSV
ncbi:MAG: filamentous hemagglutinin N-terminal domain-containing protein [Sulfuritalea sp.]|nr:filamentous hemagglutinin N-terminal domain-containing protein [Sulfuritalea sp.]MDP1982312.1 filamentous hemagglutinin N-terminal domain-containing protein [Sulfuritalea sp.]